MKFIKNIIGSLIRDIIVCSGDDFVEYKIKGDILVYKSCIPFHFIIGNYEFIPESMFYRSNNNHNN